MTDLPPPLSTPAPKSGKGLKILLAVSLALNLAVVGLVAGAMLRGHDADRSRSVAVRDFSFGPFTEALTRDQRRAMLRDFASKGPGLRDLRAQVGRDFDAVLASLRASPFDPVAFQTAVARQGEAIAARSDAARAAMVSLIVGMSDPERAEFAARLERALTRKGGKDKDEDEEERRR
ncbi:MAG: periplasmic heavy metal sensor [Rhodobacteraceae bacterium]|nr:periplasmic heavy metal sensor [Paracoccaceae bacterium]